MDNPALAKRLAIGAAVLVAVGIFAYLATGTPRGVTRATFGDHVYEIPHEYGGVSTSGIDTPKSGYAGFRFQVLLPDLAPRTNANGAELDVTGWHDQVLGLIEAFPKNYDTIDNATVLKRFLSELWFKGVIPTTTPEGYDVYIPHSKSFPELRTKPRKNGDVLILQCWQDAHIAFPGCTIFDHWDGLNMVVSFSKKYAAQAEAIDQKVRAMFLSFRKS